MKHLLALFSVAVISGCTGPVGPFSGGSLSGESGSFQGNWEFAKTVEQVQLETLDADGKPHSVNVWSGVVDNRLFLPTSLVRGAEEPGARQWVQNAIANSAVRIRIGGSIYSGEIMRVGDASFAERVKIAILSKYDTEPDPRSAQAWIFEVTSLPNG